MKKRTIISLIIMAMCIASTFKFWVIKSPLQFSFNAEGKGIVNFEIFLNKKDDNEFKKVKYGVIEANLDNSNHVELFINRVSKCKRIKIVVSSIQSPPPESQTLLLSDFSLRYNKYKLDKLEHFKAKNAKLNIIDNTLKITPLEKSYTLLYDTPVDIKGSTKFDIKILFIIATLSFLAAYKFSSYLANFKTLKNASRLDIIFLLVFFILLLIPSHKLNQENYSSTELRPLAKYQPFIKNNALNIEYGKNTEDWFNDRFYLREKLITVYANIKYKLTLNCFQINAFITNKNNRWMFDKDDIPTSQEMLNNSHAYIKNLHKLDKFCRKNNIKLYVLIIPRKEFIYSRENLYINKNSSNNTSKIISKLANEKYTNTKILYPIEELQKASQKDYIFYKTDNHWTDTGAHISYNALMSSIKEDFDDIEILKEDKFNTSENTLIKNATNFGEFVEGITYARSLLNDKKLHTTQYKYLTYKNEKEIDIKKDANQSKSFYKQRKYRVYLIGNSFSHAITPFLNATFKEVLQRRTNNGEVDGNKELELQRYKKELKEFKPDIFIICIHSSYINHFEDLFKGE